MIKPSISELTQDGKINRYTLVVAAAKSAGLTVSLAHTCNDVDTPEDLRALTAQLSPDSATWQYLNRLKKEGVTL